MKNRGFSDSSDVPSTASIPLSTFSSAASETSTAASSLTAQPTQNSSMDTGTSSTMSASQQQASTSFTTSFSEIITTVNGAVTTVSLYVMCAVTSTKSHTGLRRFTLLFQRSTLTPPRRLQIRAARRSSRAAPSVVQPSSFCASQSYSAVDGIKSERLIVHTVSYPPRGPCCWLVKMTSTWLDRRRDHQVFDVDSESWARLLVGEGIHMPGETQRVQMHT